MNGRVGTEPAGRDAECAVVPGLTGRPEGRRQLVAVAGEPGHERPSGWEPSSVVGGGARAARATLLALAPLPHESCGDQARGSRPHADRLLGGHIRDAGASVDRASTNRASTDRALVDRASVDRAGRLVDGLTDRELREVVPDVPALCWAEFDLDRFDAARGHLDRTIAVASRVRHREVLPGLLLARSSVAARQGHLADATIDAQEAAAMAGELGHVHERAFAMAVQLPVRLWQHGPTAVRGLLAAAPAPQTLAVAWWRPIAAAATADALLLMGRARAARRIAIVALHLAGRGGAHHPALLALAATTELACGRLAAATVLQRRAGSAAEAGGLDTQCGAAGLALARVLSAGGAYREAAAAASTAVARLDRCGAPLLAGRARLVAAEVASASADHDLARRELALARGAFVACGAYWLATTVAALQHRIGR